MAQLLSSLPLGSKVKFGKYSVEGEVAQDIIWLVVDTTTPSVTTLLTEKLIDIRYFDDMEPNNSDYQRRTDGSNRYSVSNIDQWLNKDGLGGGWYVPQHDADTPPSNGDVAYVNRPGFLNAFSNNEKNSIANTIVTCILSETDGSGSEQITRKIFLPSLTELGIANDDTTIKEGKRWEYLAGKSTNAFTTKQAYDNTKWKGKTGPGQAVDYLTRTPQKTYSSMVWCANYIGGRSNHEANDVNVGIRPALNLLSNVEISDTTDGDGCYTIVWNVAPIRPSNIYTPSSVYGGKSNIVSWSTSVDPDGDMVTYTLECSVNGGGYTKIYEGTALTYTHLVPFGTSTVSYRVMATDPSGESSAYTTSATLGVVNNYAPVISGTDTNLGVKNSGFTGTYTIADANSDTVTVTEAIDGVRIRSLVATLGQEITYGVTENTWLALPNGSHTLTISATDGIDTTVRTLVFTKLVETLKIQNSTPWDLSTKPSRIMLVITRNIPSTATFKVEVCNNGYDASPTWEDATDAVRSGLVHVFNNTKRTATKWGVLVRVTVERNGATGACYISAIGGNFE